eukprot:TRINITY_DN2312_c2_g1_i7.p1 TRINITY_DN2312_c2_g1~~TRINITY_DN2312_c2_g1_i7.p1  ORF type:complete len:702 (-),score=68.83 TRINITY_DN2312_c2_g1_i7:128-2233(-)
MFLIYLIFSLLGVGCNLPINAFLTAHSYFQLSLLDTEQVTWSYESLFMIVFTICNFGGLVAVIARPRCGTGSPLLPLFIFFIVLAVQVALCVQPITVGWMHVVVVFLLIGIVGSMTAQLQVSLYRLAAKFGHSYIPWLSSGQAFAGLFAALLRLIVMSSTSPGSMYCDVVYLMLCCIMLVVCIICYAILYLNGQFRLRINLDRLISMPGGFLEDGAYFEYDNQAPFLRFDSHAGGRFVQNALIVEYLDFLSSSMAMEEEPHIMLGGVCHTGPQSSLENSNAVLEQLLPPTNIQAPQLAQHNVNLAQIPSLPGSNAGFENPNLPPTEEYTVQENNQSPSRPVSLSEFSVTSASDYRNKHPSQYSYASSMKREEASFQYLVNQEGEPLITSNKLRHDDIYGKGGSGGGGGGGGGNGGFPPRRNSLEFQVPAVELRLSTSGDEEQPNSPLYYFKSFDVQEERVEKEQQDFMETNAKDDKRHDLQLQHVDSQEIKEENNKVVSQYHNNINSNENVDINANTANGNLQAGDSEIQQQQQQQQLYAPGQQLQEPLLYAQQEMSQQGVWMNGLIQPMFGYVFVIFLTYVVTFAAFPAVSSKICSVHNDSRKPPCKPVVDDQNRIFGDLFVPLEFALFHIGNLIGRWFSNFRKKGIRPKWMNLLLYSYVRVFIVIGLLFSNVVSSPKWQIGFHWPVDAVPWILIVVLGQ